MTTEQKRKAAALMLKQTDSSETELVYQILIRLLSPVTVSATIAAVIEESAQEAQKTTPAAI